MVRTVFFDFGGTLVRTWVSEGVDPAELWREPLGRYDVSVDLEALRVGLDRAAAEFDGLIYDYLGRTPEFWRRYDARVLELVGVAYPPAGLLNLLERAFRERSRGSLFPETLGALEALASRGLALGVISNHNDALPEYLEAHGLTRYFRSVTYSQQAGAEKPDRRVFDLALRRAECLPREAIHVGDSWTADYLGATAVGIRSIWVNRRGGRPRRPARRYRTSRRSRRCWTGRSRRDAPPVSERTRSPAVRPVVSWRTVPAADPSARPSTAGRGPKHPHGRTPGLASRCGT